MKIVVVGCGHGALDTIYQDIERIESKDNVKVDLLLICGDFQAVRNQHDLPCMAVPPKYRSLGEFHKYYSGQSTAPVLTLFVGGNHEASNYLQTLPYGGWVAKNIYYLGYANVLRFGGLRIAGISGIHQRGEERLGHFERLPYDENTKRSAYHTRNLEVFRLMQLKVTQESEKIDIFMSHDWPLNIHKYGDVNWLLRVKKHFYQDIQRNALGNPLIEPLIWHLKPRYWLAAHLHVRFNAFVNHNQEGTEMTNFWALDKVGGRGRYMDVLDLEPAVASQDMSLSYDPEWLSLLKMTNSLMSIDRNPSVQIPPIWQSQVHSVEEKDTQEIVSLFKDDLKVPSNFVMSEPAKYGLENDSDPQRKNNYVNPQTTQLCQLLSLTDPIQAIIDASKPLGNPDEISISDDEEEVDESVPKKPKLDEQIDGGDLFFIDTKGSQV